MNMNYVNSFICCYDISAKSIPECVTFSKKPSNIFGIVLNVMIFYAQNLEDILHRVCLQILVLFKPQRYIDMDLWMVSVTNKFCRRDKIKFIFNIFNKYISLYDKTYHYIY